MSTPETKPFPLILDNAGVTIGGKSLACVSTHVELAPEVSITTIETFCGSTDYPGVVKWTLNLTLVQSFDPDATEDILSAAVDAGVPIAYTVVGYRDREISDTNPEWSGEVVPQPYAPINGDAGAESTIDLSWACTGPPTKSITPPIAASASREKAAA